MQVIGACESEDKADVLREKGAFSTVNFKKKNIVKAVLEETNNQGVKVVFDAVGGDVFEDCLQRYSCSLTFFKYVSFLLSIVPQNILPGFYVVF